MMAFDPSPPPALDTETVEALRTALSSAAKRGNHDDELGELLARVAHEAREKHIQAESLLVTLKTIWYSLPELSSPGNRASNELLQELISRCIERYYGR